MDAVSIVFADTSTTPYSAGTIASRSMMLGGGAVILLGTALVVGVIGKRIGALPAGLLDREQDHGDPDTFHRLSRDIYVSPGDIGFWQAAFRDATDPQFDAFPDGKRFLVNQQISSKDEPINWRRGLFRMWILLSTAWIMGWTIYLILDGVQGGISNGEDIVIRVAFKPTARSFGTTTACAPKTSALRRHAPRFCGSVTPSRTSSSAGSGQVGTPSTSATQTSASAFPSTSCNRSSATCRSR